MAPTEDSIIATSSPPHFVLVPLAAPGHMIPMADLALLIAERGARASLVTTPVNAARLRGVVERARHAKLPLEIVALPFPPPAAAGDEDDVVLPPGFENIDQIKDNSHFLPLFQAIHRLAGPLEAYLRAQPQARRPSCIVADWCNSWTAAVATRVGVPRLFFHGPSCFYSLCDINVATAAEHGLVPEDESEAYAVPGMPVRVEVTKATGPGFLNSPGFEAFQEEAMEAMRTADGAVVNTFLGLEEQFVACYETALGKPVWALGPFCLVNNSRQDVASRGHDESSGADLQSAVTAWLDAMEPGSVVYASFGSLARKLPGQLFEVGHGLEDSGKPFLWVVKESEVASPEAQAWLDALETRTAGRGLVVRGWAPQLAILAHGAVGGFVTHCGWNSVIESMAHGVPVVTWPHFADQFLNEKLVVDVLGAGVSVGAAVAPVKLFDDEAVLVLRGDVARAVSELMGDGEAAEERRKKAREFGERAHRAVEKGGSSYENLTRLIQIFGENGRSPQGNLKL
ncbi:UDP-glycosyltransferase 73C3 [Brachypodium distachyon]|uniref:Glycosyltransferase n=1 Tax=Brachypodium distachyon TaxID=15368 RepID=A0A0Q3F387_BRADI|nr:UDP-glycosyltransferase 73C3 [Brachypodium distachyon]KQJ93959.1 hypothetical protein BRADI_3g07750v3 [Brachypodium distachyon]|eukprot:XP_014756598.1 UDP-glycosyltransferase 73C3 [Brachypodium distachyon]